MAEESTEQWAVVELMGHVRLSGRVSEVERFGQKLGRIDIPQADGGFVTQLFGGGSIYRVRPVTEDVARELASAMYESPLVYPLARPALPAHDEPAVEADDIPFDEGE